MNEHIVYSIQKASGAIAAIKIVPETKPGVNGRISITGIFRLFHVIPKKSVPPSIEVDIDTYMSFLGSLRFFNENFFEWRYEGQGLPDEEVTQLVKIIQDHVEELFDETDDQPVLKEEHLHDPEHALYMSDEQLAAIMDHPLYDIAPYFLFGDDDLVVGIVQDQTAFDIHINGDIAARFEVANDGEARLISGSMPEPALLAEIVRRVTAIRSL
jgi:hypothetical protein